MPHFTFVHAADLHLDSPLLGLAGKSAEFAGQVERASRQAFENLLDLAIDEGAAFVVLAGDVFDGDLRNYQTGLFFTAGMRRLQDAGVRVFLIAGNHDAENRYASRLAYSANVHLFADKAAETVEVDDLQVAVHGRSFGQRDVVDNIARNYPAARPGCFNIGVLHTACAGSEGHHAVYAPCTLEQLVNHGYDYWALGHVHARTVLNTHPHVVYPGNLQGRNSREIGAKGATVVRVEDGRVVRCEHRDLDVVRWATLAVDVSGAADLNGVVKQTRDALASAIDAAAGRPLALRLRLGGATPAHGVMLINPAGVREDMESLLASLAADIWLEKLELKTTAPVQATASDPTIAGQLQAEIKRLASDLGPMLEACLTELRSKTPAGARVEELFARLRDEAPDRALSLALSLASGDEAGLAD